MGDGLSEPRLTRVNIRIGKLQFKTRMDNQEAVGENGINSNYLQPPEDIVSRRKVSFDVIMEQINRVEKSKARWLLNAIYSLICGVVVSVLTKDRVRYSKTLGLICSLLAFFLSKKGFNSRSCE